jgi:hypothetical protein
MSGVTEAPCHRMTSTWEDWLFQSVLRLLDPQSLSFSISRKEPETEYHSMTSSRSYLQVEVVVVASTVIALSILAAITSYITSTTAVGLAYVVFVCIALFILLISLGIGCHGMIKSLLLLGCDQWNIRMVIPGFIIQIILLCMGLLCYSISLFFI